MDKPTGFTFGSPAAKPVVGFGAPAAQTTGAAAAPATGFSFGSPAPAAGTTPAPTLSFGLGGSAAPAASLAPAATTAAPTLSFGGFGLSKPAAPAATTTSAAPAAAAPAFGGFSGFGTATTSTPAAATSITLTSTSAAPVSTLTLGAPAVTTTSAPALTLTSSATSNPLTNLTTTTTTTQSSAASAQPAGAQLNFCQLEEHINKWTLELEEQEKIFTNQATQINAWDRVLLENSDKIVALNDSFAKVKTEQKALEQELEYIAAQHAELDECIKPLEKEMARSQQFDPEREQTYLMAESLDTQMKQMGEDLKEVIEHLNEANRDRDPNDPIVQIGKILNAHMSSLQWIENSTSHITAKLENISKLQETLRRDNERSFRVNI